MAGSGWKAFISHASEDARIADGLCAFLERAGIDCWIAPRDVTPGREYAAEILDGIESSAVFVLLLSAQANRSPFVRRELERAASKDKPVFLVRIEDVAPDRSLELFVSSEHWIDAWQEPVEAHWVRLADAIQGRRAAASGSATAPRRRVPVMALVVGAGAGVVTAVALVAGWQLLGEGGQEAVRPQPLVQEAATTGSAPPAVSAPPAPGPLAASTGDDAPGPCPQYFAINPDLPTPFTCVCGAAGTYTHSAVWGTDVYTADSGLCQAALHAGAIPRAGGKVVVERMPGRDLYAGTERNGVTSSDYGRYHPAIHFAGTALPAAVEPCPAHLSLNPDLVTPFSCVCSGDAIHNGAVWGSDIYTADSGLCRAALHAGKVTRAGGTISVVFAEGRSLYVGSSRNGVGSADYGAYPLSIRFP